MDVSRGPGLALRGASLVAAMVVLSPSCRPASAAGRVVANTVPLRLPGRGVVVPRSLLSDLNVSAEGPTADRRFVVAGTILSSAQVHHGLRLGLDDQGLCSPGLKEVLVDHSAGNPRMLCGLAADLLDAALHSEKPILDEALYFDVFDRTPKRAAKKAGARS